MTSWDPGIYLKFGGERTRAAADLVARIPLEAPKGIADIGCGPGNSTALLATRYPDADILGLDSSTDMLEQARATKLKARWQEADFDEWTPDAAYDLLYANAAFHWSRDPVALTVRLYRTLTPGGAIALQVPQNFDQPSHIEINAAADAGPWRAKLKAVRQYNPAFDRAADYARALAPLGPKLDVWSTEYLHILEGEDPVFRWISGTALRPFTELLAGAERNAFEADVRARLLRAYPPEADGRTLFPFRRLFVIAQKAK